MELGNLTIGALVLGQFVSEKQFSGSVFMAGVLLAVLCYTGNYLNFVKIKYGTSCLVFINNICTCSGSGYSCTQI